MSETDHDILATRPRLSAPSLDVPRQATEPLSAWSGAMFCPRRGVNHGAARRVSSETTRLLQDRLKVMAPLMSFVEALASLRFAFLTPAAAVIPGITATVAAIATVLLWRRPRMSSGELRAIKVVLVLGGLVVGLAMNQYLVLSDNIAAGDSAAFLTNLSRMPGLWLMVMVAYAMFIPDTARQASAFVLVCVVADATVALALRLRFGPIEGMLDTTELIETGSFGILVLVAGGGIAVFGTHAMNRMRRTMAEMGDAGMYRLLGKLGAGGMGEVWRAEHRMLSRPAAIKIIRPDLLDSNSRIDAATVTGRFEREARATASLQSPHTVQLYDFGVTEDGTFFYVMEYLNGMNLDDLVRRFGPLPPSRAIYLLGQAAESLEEAHRRGMVHRDIKPANLNVGALAGQYDWLKVLDFGLVKSFRGDLEGSSRLTQEGLTTGTPAYFPPELAHGAATADARTDVYALAAVGYYLLTGQLVFEGAGPMDLVVKHIRDEPVAPSRRVELPISAALDATILAGLRKAPHDRPQSMLEFSRLLAEADPGPGWSDALASEWWRLHVPEATEPLVA